jgi:excisionase family DNA binding protein
MPSLPDELRPQNDRGRPSEAGSALLTAAEVAQLLGVPRTWVYEQSRRGAIPTVTLGRYRRYRRAAIDAWLERLEAGGVSAGRRDRVA